MENSSTVRSALPADRQLTELFSRIGGLAQRQKQSEAYYTQQIQQSEEKIGKLRKRIEEAKQQMASYGQVSGKAETALKNFFRDYGKEIEQAYLTAYKQRQERYKREKNACRQELDDIKTQNRAAEQKLQTAKETNRLAFEYRQAWEHFEKQYPWYAKILNINDILDIIKITNTSVQLGKLIISYGPKQSADTQLLKIGFRYPNTISFWQKLVYRWRKRRNYPQNEIDALEKLARKFKAAAWQTAHSFTPEETDAFVKNSEKKRYEMFRELEMRLAKRVAQNAGKLEVCQKKLDSVNVFSYLEQPCSPENFLRAGGKLFDHEKEAILKRVFSRHRDCPEEILKRADSFPDPYLDSDAGAKIAAIIRLEYERQSEAARHETEAQKRTLSHLAQQSEQFAAEFARLQETRLSERAKLEEENREWLAGIETLRHADPVTVPLWGPAQPAPEEARKLCREIAAAAAQRVTMPALPVSYETKPGLPPKPVFAFWQNTNAYRSNFVIDYPRGKTERAVATMHNLLMGMLLAFPAKKLRFTFVDLNVTNTASLFTINLDGQLYHNQPVVREQDLRKTMEELQDRMVSVSMQCGNLLEYNQNNGTILLPYEVVVLLDYPKNLSATALNQLKPLCTNGYKGGVFFVVMREQEADRGTSAGSQPDIVTPDSFQTIPLLPQDKTGGEEGYRFLPISENETLCKACFAYINEEAQKEEEARILVQPLEGLSEAPLEDAASDFRVSVGENNGRTASFQFDEINHIHSFVLGQSGSGKSVFLHNVIANAILHYAPESLQLYLLDFKLGGVEFNRYRDIKHVKALLVDNSDQQITLEILRGLHETMQQRGETLRNAGASTLKEYNQSHPESKLPRIVLVADECHELFRDRVDKTQAEINAIVAKIAKEGRSQGVHLLFATQTLANANISPEILNNITDHYLLKCSQNDAEKLVRDSSKQTSSLTTGWIFYRHFDEQNLFQAYYADKQRLQHIIEEAGRKTETSAAGDRFFFSGKQSFPLESSVRTALERRIRRSPVALMGRSIDVKLEPVGFPLNAALSENVLLFGINTKEQTTRTSLNLLLTLMASYGLMGRPGRFYVINCLNSAEKTAAEDLLYKLEFFGCTVVENAARGELLSTLSNEVRSRTAQESVVLLLGQERFREIRLEQPLPAAAPAEEQPAAKPGFLGDLGAFGRERDKRTYKSELRYLLENGPEQNVHFLLQVDKPGNLLFENVISQQMVFSMFKHIVMLKSAPDAVLKLRLSDDLKLENLSDDPERLRAYYYNDEEGSYTLFTPYLNPDHDQLSELLK